MISLFAPLSHPSPVLCEGSLTRDRESLHKQSISQLDIETLDGCIQKCVRILKAEQLTTSILVSRPPVG